MRTTIDIEDDVLAAAKELARMQNVSAGQVVSRLLRNALAGEAVQGRVETRQIGGFRPFPARGPVVTSDKVDQLRDEEGSLMRALLDVNVLIALLDGGHIHHGLAMSWLEGAIRHGWASCLITRNGCVRIMSQPNYPPALPAGQVAERLAEASASPDHEFCPADVNLLGNGVIAWQRMLGHRQVTDAHLLALAVQHGGRLVTLGRRVDPEAVRGARPEHLVALAAN